MSWRSAAARPDPTDAQRISQATVALGTFGVGAILVLMAEARKAPGTGSAGPGCGCAVPPGWTSPGIMPAAGACGA